MPARQSPDLPSENPISLWMLFLNTRARLLSAVEAGLIDCDLPHNQFDVLQQLQQAGGRMRPTELAEMVMLSKSGLTRLVDRMQKAGLVQREDYADDGRGALVGLTRKGREARKKALPRYRTAIRNHFLDRLAPWEQHAFADILMKLNAPR